jgi:DNA-binding MarR family transcriptional regulator
MKCEAVNKKLLLKNLPRGSNLAALAALYPETDVLAMEVYGSLLGLAAEIVTAVNAALARRGVTQARFRLLLHLRRAGAGGLHPMDLAEALGVERATITGLVDGVEKDGLARRLPCPSDRRSIMVALTSRGKRLIDSIAPDRLRAVSRLMSGFSSAEKTRFSVLLGRLGANLPAFKKI